MTLVRFALGRLIQICFHAQKHVHCPSDIGLPVTLPLLEMFEQKIQVHHIYKEKRNLLIFS